MVFNFLRDLTTVEKLLRLWEFEAQSQNHKKSQNKRPSNLRLSIFFYQASLSIFWYVFSPQYDFPGEMRKKGLRSSSRVLSKMIKQLKLVHFLVFNFLRDLTTVEKLLRLLLFETQSQNHKKSLIFPILLSIIKKNGPKVVLLLPEVIFL